MPWFSIQVFFGSKVVAEEPVRARDEGHANRLAAYVSKTVARDAIPPFLWDERKVSWVVLPGCRATADVA